MFELKLILPPILALFGGLIALRASQVTTSFISRRIFFGFLLLEIATFFSGLFILTDIFWVGAVAIVVGVLGVLQIREW